MLLLFCQTTISHTLSPVRTWKDQKQGDPFTLTHTHRKTGSSAHNHEVITYSPLQSHAHTLTHTRSLALVSKFLSATSWRVIYPLAQLFNPPAPHLNPNLSHLALPPRAIYTPGPDLTLHRNESYVLLQAPSLVSWQELLHVYGSSVYIWAAQRELQGFVTHIKRKSPQLWSYSNVKNTFFRVE